MLSGCIFSVPQRAKVDNPDIDKITLCDTIIIALQRTNFRLAEGYNTMAQQESMPRYAIFETGGKQYQAIEGQTVAVEKIDAQAGETVTFDRVLLRRDNENIEIGQPHLDTPVKASVIKHDRGPKLVVFKMKRRKKYRRKHGHRQDQTVVRIEQV